MRSKYLFIPVLISALPIAGQSAGSLSAGSPADPPAQAAAADDDVRPLIARYCTNCHSGAEPKGDLALDKLTQTVTTHEERETWDRIFEMLDSREMPPKGKPQPSDAERTKITRWIDAQFARFDCTGKKHPGRVTLRRLNRVEYNQTIRDLLGVDFQPAADFPSDDVGYGFDNIGDVLSISPILLEKYLAAAEQIAQKAIGTDPAARGAVRRVESRQLDGGERLGPRVVVSRKPASAKFDVLKAGDYTIRVQAHGALAGDRPPKLVVRLDDREILTARVDGTRDDPRNYTVELHVPAGRHTLWLAEKGQAGSDPPADSLAKPPLLIINFVELIGPSELPESHRRIVSCTPGKNQPAEACARRILRDFATRAFRRPVASEELDRLVKLALLAPAQGDPFERGIQLAVQAVLVSPHFLFRVELDPDPKDKAGYRALNDYELASRLSYFLWSTMPDVELFRLAEQGALHQPEVLEAQVRRMLADPKSESLVKNFAGQWLQLRDLAKLAPDPESFPEFDDSLRAAMVRETELFFASVIRENRSILDFLDARDTWVNPRLARHYGISGVSGDEFRRVPLPENQRRGILTHASILTITSNPTRTSPVKRGKWILENLLGTPPPPPPANVDELPEGKEAALRGSLRQRMEQHRSKPMCAACHARMDPLGFAFENFDAIGAWRDFDGKFTIDPAGELPSGDRFDGPTGLAALLKDAKRTQFCRCLAEKMLTYALGRGLEYADRCAVDEIIKRLEKAQYRFSSLVLAVVQSDPFQLRGAKGGDE